MRFVAVLALLLTGCAVNPTLTPEQIMASVKDKNAGAWCIDFSGPGTSVKASGVNFDKGVIQSGNITVSPTGGSCVVSVTAEARPPK